MKRMAVKQRLREVVIWGTLIRQTLSQALHENVCSVALLSCVADMSNTFRLIICVVVSSNENGLWSCLLRLFYLGTGWCLLMKARSLSNQCDFCSEHVLSNLSARSATHLQLLPLKLKVYMTDFFLVTRLNRPNVLISVAKKFLP